MRPGRWYPTQVLLADGRTVVLDGLDERGEPNVNRDRELHPNLDFVTLLSVRGHRASRRRAASTRTLFQMPSGRVLRRGPGADRHWFFRLSGIGALSWEDRRTRLHHTWGTGVLLPGAHGRLDARRAIGGVDRDSLPDTGTVDPAPERRDLRRANPQPGWTAAPPLESRARPPQHGAAARPLDGDGRRRLRDPERQPALGRRAVHRNIELCDAATGSGRSARRRPRSAPITRPRCCCPTAG